MRDKDEGALVLLQVSLLQPAVLGDPRVRTVRDLILRIARS